LAGPYSSGIIEDRYKDSKFVTVRPPNHTEDLERGAFMRPDTLNNTNKLELSVGRVAPHFERCVKCHRLTRIMLATSYTVC